MSLFMLCRHILQLLKTKCQVYQSAFKSKFTKAVATKCINWIIKTSNTLREDHACSHIVQRGLLQQRQPHNYSKQSAGKLNLFLVNRVSKFVHSLWKIVTVIPSNIPQHHFARRTYRWLFYFHPNSGFQLIQCMTVDRNLHRMNVANSHRPASSKVAHGDH